MREHRSRPDPTHVNPWGQSIPAWPLNVAELATFARLRAPSVDDLRLLPDITTTKTFIDQLRLNETPRIPLLGIEREIERLALLVDSARRNTDVEACEMPKQFREELEAIRQFFAARRERLASKVKAAIAGEFRKKKNDILEECQFECRKKVLLGHPCHSLKFVVPKGKSIHSVLEEIAKLYVHEHLELSYLREGSSERPPVPAGKETRTRGLNIWGSRPADVNQSAESGGVKIRIARWASSAHLSANNLNLDLPTADQFRLAHALYFLSTNGEDLLEGCSNGHLRWDTTTSPFGIGFMRADNRFAEYRAPIITLSPLKKRGIQPVKQDTDRPDSEVHALLDHLEYSFNLGVSRFSIPPGMSFYELIAKACVLSGKHRWTSPVRAAQLENWRNDADFTYTDDRKLSVGIEGYIPHSDRVPKTEQLLHIADWVPRPIRAGLYAQYAAQLGNVAARELFQRKSGGLVNTEEVIAIYVLYNLAFGRDLFCDLSGSESKPVVIYTRDGKVVTSCVKSGTATRVVAVLDDPRNDAPHVSTGVGLARLLYRDLNGEPQCGDDDLDRHPIK